MIELGVFNEGVVDGPFYSAEAALRALEAEDPVGESGLEILEVCTEHPEQPREGCAECAAEDSE